MSSKPLLVLQYSDANTMPLLQLTHGYHKKFSENCGYDYIIETNPVDPNKHPFWQKPLLLQKYQRLGYGRIVWLDTDTLWLGEPLEPFENSVHEKIGMVKCWHYEPNLDHHNAGVIYINDFILPFIQEWLDEPDDGNPNGDNWAMKKLVDRNRVPGLVTLGYKWNSFMQFPAYRHKGFPFYPPRVAAWHGCHNVANRARLMSEYINQNLTILEP